MCCIGNNTFPICCGICCCYNLGCERNSSAGLLECVIYCGWSSQWSLGKCGIDSSKGNSGKKCHAVLARLKLVSDKTFPLLFLLRNQMQIFGSEVFEIFARSFAVICLGSDQLNVLACRMKVFQSPLLFSAIGFRVQCYGLTNHGRWDPKCD